MKRIAPLLIIFLICIGIPAASANPDLIITSSGTKMGSAMIPSTPMSWLNRAFTT